MTAREFFVAARDAVQRITEFQRRLEAKRELSVMRARSDGPRGKGGVADPSRRIDDLIEFEAESERERRQDTRLVLDADRVIAGYSEIDRAGAAVLRMRYLNLMPWRNVAEAAGVDYDAVRSMESVAFDRIDSEGIAAMRGGVLKSTGAEL